MQFASLEWGMGSFQSFCSFTAEEMEKRGSSPLPVLVSVQFLEKNSNLSTLHCSLLTQVTCILPFFLQLKTDSFLVCI